MEQPLAKERHLAGTGGQQGQAGARVMLTMAGAVRLAALARRRAGSDGSKAVADQFLKRREPLQDGGNGPGVGLQERLDLGLRAVLNGLLLAFFSWVNSSSAFSVRLCSSVR